MICFESGAQPFLLNTIRDSQDEVPVSSKILPPSHNCSSFLGMTYVGDMWILSVMSSLYESFCSHV